MWSIRITLLLVALCVCESVSIGRKKKTILESAADNPSDLVEALRVIDRERRRLGLGDKEEPILVDSPVNNNNYNEDYGVAREGLDDADDDVDVQVETRDYVPEDELSESRGRVDGDIPLAEHLSHYKKKREVPLNQKNRRYFKGTKNKRRPMRFDQAASKLYGNERNGGEDSNNDYKTKLNYMTSQLDDPIEAAVNKLSTKDIHKLISLIKLMENEKKRILAEQEREYEDIAEQPSKGEMKLRETSSVTDEESTENYYPKQQQKPESYSDINLLNQNKKPNAISKQLDALYRKTEKRARNLGKVRQSYQRENENEEPQSENEEETEELEPEFSESAPSDITPFDFSKAQLNIGNPDVAKVIALLWINYKLEGMEINYLTDAIHAATASQSQSSSSSFDSIPAEIGNLKKAMNVEKVMKDFGIKDMDTKSSEALDLLALSYLKRYARLPKNMIDLINSKLTEVAQQSRNYVKRGDYFNEEVTNPKTTKRYNTKPLKYQTSGNQRQDIRQYIPSDVKELTAEDFQDPGTRLPENSYGNKDSPENTSEPKESSQPNHRSPSMIPARST